MHMRIEIDTSVGECFCYSLDQVKFKICSSCKNYLFNAWVGKRYFVSAASDPAIIKQYTVIRSQTHAADSHTSSNSLPILIPLFHAVR
ncbi:hypothetical protein EYC80_005758 [Monilinia laxa]|uniref:Uncharacterized protein n=1 Tax=Monilinia laxa TaxID=61186 RepID=A0A5N6KF77_MONLA|nr:hypothetical protein EYC80_005758 [Monilinia laxa]